jgi:phosphatidylglycerophosphate synthase
MDAPRRAAKPVRRIQQNLLAIQERRLLTWLCARMPGWVTPDLLTASGMVGAGMILAGYIASNWGREWLLLSVAGYFVHWFGDSMDGSLARFRQIERPNFGYFVDHSCDALATVMILGGIGLSPFVQAEAAMIALTGYLLLSIHAFLAARVMGELRLSYMGGGPTELRLLLIALTAIMYVNGGGPHLIGSVTGLDLFIGTVGILLIVLFVIQSMTAGRVLIRQGD